MTVGTALAADVIDGRLYAADLKDRVEAEVRVLARRGVRPGLATVLAGDNYPAEAYERRVRRLAGELDCHYVCERIAADILIVASGVPGLVSGEHVKEGVIAIDVGINPVTDPETGKVGFVGDLDFDTVAAKARAISPVPGGVGPITDVWLLHNTVSAARLAAEVAAAQPSLEGLTAPPGLPSV